MMSAGTLHPLNLRTQVRRRTLAPTPPTKHSPAYQPVQRRVSICPLYLSRYPQNTYPPPQCPRSAGRPCSRQFPFPRHEHTLSKGNTCLRNRTCDTARRRRRCRRRRRRGPRSYESCHLSPVTPTPQSVSQSVSVRPSRRALSQPGQLQPSTRSQPLPPFERGFQISFHQIAARSSQLKDMVRVGNLWYCVDKVVPRGEDI
jgi:hypothetical protein